MLQLFIILLPGLSSGDTTIDLAGASVRHGQSASDLERFAAREIARYLRLLSGRESPVGALRRREGDRPGAEVLVGTTRSLRGIAELPEALGPEGYVLRALSREPARLLVAGREPAGAQRGAYALIERLGVGFYLGGDALPERRDALLVPADLDASRSPVFRIRGSLPWYNFLNSPTTWDLEDYQAFFDSMTKMGMNFVGFHSYDSEPFCAYPWEGAWRMGAPAATSLDYGWGALRGLKTEQFGFGTGRCFPYDAFGSRSVVLAGQPPAGPPPAVFPRKTVADEAVLRAQAVLAQGLEYARRRGLHACLGFELTGDPTAEENRRQAEARIRNLLASFPMLDHVWFWQSEGLGGGSAAPSSDSPLDLAVARLRPAFEYLREEGRIAEAARVALWVDFAARVVRGLRPDIRMIVSGWGGDAWMRFSDFYAGLDKVLPEDIVFAALDNIDPTAQTHVSEVYGKLSPGRERWPIPWWESDGGGTRRDQWFSQANAKPFTHLARDARAKGCQGLLAIHWQTRGVEEVAAYVAQYAWDPDLSYEDFYRTFARKCFGEKHGPEMASILARLEALGPRWTGGPGQVECGGFQWFSDDRRPREENFKALEEIDAALARIAADFRSGPGLRHAERMRYLRASVAFARLFDRAAVDLDAGGKTARMVDAAEAARKDGKADEAKRLAREALDALAASSLGPAMEDYADRLTSQGDFGNLATINVKAYAAFLGLWERARAALGEDRPPPGTTRRIEGPALVAKTPPTAVPEGVPLPVRAVVIGERTVKETVLRFRAPGDEWREVPMKAAGRGLFEAEIPGEAVGPRGIEYAVLARGEGGAEAAAPVGYPEVVFSASGLPFPPVVSYGPFLHRDMAFAPWYSADLAGKAVALRLTLLGAREYESPAAKAILGGLPVEAPSIYGIAALPVPQDLLEAPRLQVILDGASSAGRGRGPRGATIGMPPPPAAPASVRVEVIEPFHARVSWDAGPGWAWEVHRSDAAGFEPAPATLIARSGWPVNDDVAIEPGKRYEYAVLAVDDAGRRSAPARSAAVAVDDAPLPPAPKGLTAKPGLGRIALQWEKVAPPVRGYAVFTAGPGGEIRVSGDTPVKESRLVVALDDGAPRRFTVRAVDRAKRLGPPSEPVEAAALPVPREPVLAIDFAAGARAATGQEGKLAGKAAVRDGVLDVREGGWIAFAGEEVLQAGAPLTVALRVQVDRIEGIPVLISFGHWDGPGWWLQLIGGKVRWYLPVGKILDAGALSTGSRHHIAATYDGRWSRLSIDGKEAGSLEVGPVDPAPWGGELRIGTYSEIHPQFQTLGTFDDVRIWRRALSAEELRKEAERGRG
jgi:hypothetical protein